MMLEYSRKIDWQINSDVKIELTKRWIDTSRLLISTTKGSVFIKGQLVFYGNKAAIEMADKLSILKNMNSAIRGLRNVRSIRWKLDGFQLIGTQWNLEKGKEKPSSPS